MHMPKTALGVFIALLGTHSAHARDLKSDEILKLREAGTLQAVELMNAAAQERHPHSVILETEVEKEYGRYFYQLELRDAQGITWDLEFDAVTGQILRDYQDR